MKSCRGYGILAKGYWNLCFFVQFYGKVIGRRENDKI